MLLLASLALAQTTRLFPDDAGARAWIRSTRSITHQRLPIVGPPAVERLVRFQGFDVRLVTVSEGQDLDAIAQQTRLEDGAACALVFTPAEEGWVGWVNGRCGQLALGSWQLSGDRVLDFRGVPLTVAQFAVATRDARMLKTYRRLDRRRGRAITFGLLGSGALWFALISEFEGGASLSPPVLYGVAGVGAALSVASIVEFGLVLGNPKSAPRDIAAHITHEEMRRRVIEHNKRLSVFIGPGSAHGTF